VREGSVSEVDRNPSYAKSPAVGVARPLRPLGVAGRARSGSHPFPSLAGPPPPPPKDLLLELLDYLNNSGWRRRDPIGVARARKLIRRCLAIVEPGRRYNE